MLYCKDLIFKKQTARQLKSTGQAFIRSHRLPGKMQDSCFALCLHPQTQPCGPAGVQSRGKKGQRS